MQQLDELDAANSALNRRLLDAEKATRDAATSLKQSKIMQAESESQAQQKIKALQQEKEAADE